MFWIALGILALGAVIKTVGAVQQTEAAAQADTLKAQQLQELSKTGGYYDQQLAALDLELKNVQADREAAGQMQALQAAGYGQQEVQAERQGAQKTGSIAAQAGAGNLAQTGSVQVQKNIVSAETQESMASIQRNIDASRLQYENTMRGLAEKEATVTAQETLVQYNKTTGTQNANALSDEADWLKSWGVGLDIASGVVGAAGQALGMGLGQTASSGGQQTAQAYDYSTGGNLNLGGSTDPFASVASSSYAVGQ